MRHPVETCRMDPDLEAVLQGQATAGFRRFVEALAVILSARWWSGDDPCAAKLAERICAHAVRGSREHGKTTCRARLMEAIAQSEEPGFADGVLDPLLEMLAEIRQSMGWTSRAHEIYLRCFLLEIAMVEGWRVERESSQKGGLVGGELWTFLANKARPVLRRYFSGGHGDADDALSELAQGLLCLDGGIWRRKTMEDFDRSKASLAAFVIQAARYHSLDVLNKYPGEIPLPENQDLEEGLVAPPEEDAKTDESSMEEWVRIVMQHDRHAPACLNPATSVGRKRLVLLEGFFLSHLADERQGAHTCKEGTAQMKFVFTQGIAPALVLGALGGEESHARLDDERPVGASESRQLLTRGFSEGGCRQYLVTSGTREEAWLHWRVLYTTVFFAVVTSAGLLELRPGLLEREPGQFDIARMRSWCLRRSPKDREPARMEFEQVLMTYQSWIGDHPQAGYFPIREEKDSVRLGHTYPHVLLSSYASNAFCALYVGAKLGKPWCVDELRIALKDLRKAMKRAG